MARKIPDGQAGSVIRVALSYRQALIAWRQANLDEELDHPTEVSSEQWWEEAREAEERLFELLDQYEPRP